LTGCCNTLQTLTTCRYINDGQSNFEYLSKFEIEFVYILGHESGAKVR
jgi:hypothetical protein